MIIRHLLLLFEYGFLGTIHTDKLYGEFDGLITLFINKSFKSCLLISSLWIFALGKPILFNIYGSIVGYGEFMCDYIDMT